MAKHRRKDAPTIDGLVCQKNNQQLWRASVDELTRNSCITTDSITLKADGHSFKIPIERTKAFHSQSRPWFKCDCGRRVGVLYGHGARIGCRLCLGLHYFNSTAPHIERLQRRAQTIRARIQEHSTALASLTKRLEKIDAQLYAASSPERARKFRDLLPPSAVRFKSPRAERKNIACDDVQIVR